MSDCSKQNKIGDILVNHNTKELFRVVDMFKHYRMTKYKLIDIRLSNEDLWIGFTEKEINLYFSKCKAGNILYGDK